jgi:RimJ/RimL family protein N-acetyltransferase
MREFLNLKFEGRHACLVPLEMSHLDGLLCAANFSRTTFQFTPVPLDVDAMKAYISTAIDGVKDGSTVPFTILDRKTGRIVGSTRYTNLEYWKWSPNHPLKRSLEIPDALEVGWTWLSEEFQRTGINTDCKILLLTYAFEALKVHRVTFKTDARNEKSRTNIERIGAKLDGIIRNHMPAYDGEIRNSAYYSIIREEWPAVIASLKNKLR